MYFSSVSELFYMNGHGVYVWASYAIGFMVLAALTVQSLLRHATLRRQILQQDDGAQ